MAYRGPNSRRVPIFMRSLTHSANTEFIGRNQILFNVIFDTNNLSVQLMVFHEIDVNELYMFWILEQTLKAKAPWFNQNNDLELALKILYFLLNQFNKRNYRFNENICEVSRERYIERHLWTNRPSYVLKGSLYQWNGRGGRRPLSRRWY